MESKRAWRKIKRYIHIKLDTIDIHINMCLADQQPCTYEVKLESKFIDMKKPLPFNRDFFDTSNMDLSVTGI